MGVRRTTIINYLIKKNDYERYLEIGVRDSSLNFDNIKCRCKEGVDPNPKKSCKYMMTSDIFFKKISKNKIYDIIFIDGLHLYQQVLKDINNSLCHLSSNGVIVLHDCNPMNKKFQTSIPPNSNKGSKWHGTVWKAFALLRMTRNDLDMSVVDTDCGCGIIKRGSQKIFKKVSISDLNYEFLKANRKKLLKLCSVKIFKQMYK